MTGRKSHECREAPDKSAETVVADVETDVGYVGLRRQQQAFGAFQPQRVEELVWRNARNLPEDAIEMIGADIRYPGHLLQRERLIQSVMHHSDDALYGFTMRDDSSWPYVVHLPNGTGGVVNGYSIHNDSHLF